MKFADHNGSYLIRLLPGEELVATLTKFCQAQNITGGWISGLGAVRAVELAFFSVHTKQYTTKQFTGEFEVTNITGNITVEKLHIHITLGDNKFQALAGHCNAAVADPTLEIMIMSFPETQRALDTYSGLNLLDLASTPFLDTLST